MTDIHTDVTAQSLNLFLYWWPQESSHKCTFKRLLNSTSENDLWTQTDLKLEISIKIGMIQFVSVKARSSWLTDRLYVLILCPMLNRQHLWGLYLSIRLFTHGACVRYESSSTLCVLVLIWSCHLNYNNNNNNIQ